MAGNPAKDFGLLSKIDVDYLILQGPMLTSTFRTLWEPTFKALRAKGTKIILLSAAFFQYSEKEIADATSFLKEYPPFIISTRDADSFSHIQGLAPHTYSGIDSAFFAPKAYTPVKFDTRPYICLNFDQYPEPNIIVNDALSKTTLGQLNGGSLVNVERSLQLGDRIGGPGVPSLS